MRWRSTRATGLRQSDEANDPPGIVGDGDIDYIADLATYLSYDRSWMTARTLQTLEQMSLRIDEVFDRAPRYFSYRDTVYELKLEIVGSLWKDFDIENDPYFVFLSQELYTGLGQDRVRAFKDGVPIVAFEQDFANSPALGLTVATLAPNERPTRGALPKQLGEPFGLGQARLLVDRGQSNSNAHTGAYQVESSCVEEVAPSCSNGRPVCDSGYTPYFLLNSLKIKVDHEGMLKGNPEIELYPLNIESSSSSATNDTSTYFIFDGRTVSDLAGRTRYLPNVNDKHTWYNLNGAAVMNMSVGDEWAGTLVENDDTTGIIKMSGSKTNDVKLFFSAASAIYYLYEMNYFKFFKSLVGLAKGLFSGDGDDLFQESIGVTSDLYCNDGLGQPFPKIFTMSSAEWDMKGYFACVNPTCGGGGGGGGGGGCLLDCDCGGFGQPLCP